MTQIDDTAPLRRGLGIEGARAPPRGRALGAAGGSSRRLQAAAASAGTGFSSLGPAIKGVRTLVVEDDQDSLEMLCMILEGAGAKVTAATNAHEALDAQGPFDIIVSDIGLPGMDGYAFIRAVRARESGTSVPAIAVTAYSRPEDVERAKGAGYQEHMSKPVDVGKLLEAVKKWGGSGGAGRTTR